MFVISENKTNFSKPMINTTKLFEKLHIKVLLIASICGRCKKGLTYNNSFFSIRGLVGLVLLLLGGGGAFLAGVKAREGCVAKRVELTMGGCGARRLGLALLLLGEQRLLFFVVIRLCFLDLIPRRSSHFSSLIVLK